MGRSLLRFDARTGARSASFRDALPSARCSFVPWGDRAIVRCADGRFNQVFTPGRGFSPLPWHSSGAAIVLSDDGVHAVLPDPCQSVEGAPGISHRAALCSLDAEGRLRNLWHQQGFTAIHAMRGALATFDDMSDANSTLFVLDADRRTVEPVAMGVPDGSSIRASGIAPDRTIWRLFREPAVGTDRLSLHRGGSTRTVSLPDEHVVVAVLNGRDLLAGGEDWGFFSVSTDGGARWRSAQIQGFRGELQRITEYSFTGLRGDWRCADDGCQLGSLWFGRDPLVDGDVVVAPPTARRRSEPPNAPRLQPLAFDCVSALRTLPDPHERHSAEWGTYSLRATVHDRETVSIDVRWRSANSPAIQRSTSARASLARTGRLFDLDPAFAWSVPLANERFAWVERCVSGGVYSECDRFVAAGSELRPLHDLSGFGKVEGWARRDNGSFVVLLGDSPTKFRRVLAVDRDGVVRATHDLPPSQGGWEREFVATRGALAGVLVYSQRADDAVPSFVALFDGDRVIAPRLEPIAFDLRATPEVCVARRQRGAVTVWTTSAGWVPTVGEDDGLASGTPMAVFELSPGRAACVRALDSHAFSALDIAADTNIAASSRFDALTVRSDRGALTGTSLRDGSLRSVRCVVR